MSDQKPAAAADPAGADPAAAEAAGPEAAETVDSPGQNERQPRAEEGTPMSTTHQQPDQQAAQTENNLTRYLWNPLRGFVSFFWEIIKNIGYMLRATVFLFINTLPVLLPSVVHTTSADTEYNKWLSNQLKEIAKALDLDLLQQKIINENWISQMNWVENRATRERNANELIRWWQIILGVLIPVFIQVGLETVASLAGVFVAVITAVHQFPPPGGSLAPLPGAVRAVPDGILELCHAVPGRVPGQDPSPGL